MWPVPTLKTLCTMAICDHLDMLTSVGDVPDELILPILNRCTPEQLLVHLPTHPLARHMHLLILDVEWPVLLVL